MEIDHVVRHAARLAPHDVDESEQACASFPGFLHRGERVRRLAGLGVREEELSLGDDRLAVPVLTGDVDIAGDTGKALDQDLPHECRMTRRAAAHQGYPRQRTDLFVRELHVLVEDDTARSAVDT